MSKTWIQRAFAPLKRTVPLRLSSLIRSTVTAFVGPLRSAYRSGFIKSAFANRAVDQNGDPLPWYTYPSIDFLKTHSFTGKHILEFGCGQSTLWWASRSERVVGIEENAAWAEEMRAKAPNNVRIKFLPISTDNYHRRIFEELGGDRFDVIIVDGGNRWQACKAALDLLREGGAIVCDNSEGYGIFDALSSSDLLRVDFYGACPGVVLPHCTSIFFRSDCWMFENISKPVVNL